MLETQESSAVGGAQQQKTSQKTKSSKKHRQAAGFMQDPVWTLKDQSSGEKATRAPTGLPVPLTVSRGSSPISSK